VGVATGYAIIFLPIYVVIWLIGKPISQLIIVFIFQVLVGFIYLNAHKRKVKDALNSNYDFAILFIRKNHIKHELGHILYHKEIWDKPMNNKGFFDGIRFGLINLIKLDREM
jgi:hypothetical protein